MNLKSWVMIFVTLLTIVCAGMFWVYVWTHCSMDWKTIGLVVMSMILTWVGFDLANKWWRIR